MHSMMIEMHWTEQSKEMLLGAMMKWMRLNCEEKQLHFLSEARRITSVYRIMKWAIKFSSYFTNRRWKSYGEPAGRHAGNMWPLNWIKMIQMKTSIKWTAGTIVITGKVRKKWSEKSGKKELAGIDFGKPMRTVWKSKRAGIASNPLYLLTH